MNPWPRRISLVAGMLLVIVLVVAAICSAAFDHALYHDVIVKHGIDAGLGMDIEDVDRVTQVLIDYCRGVRDDLDVTVTVDGQQRQFFNDKEIMHMQDVQVLFRFAFWLLGLSLLGFVLLMLFAGTKSGWDMPMLLKQCAKGMGIVLGIIVAICVFAMLDFSTFWTIFHYVFMWNELWLLNPATDLLIVLMPLNFFFDICLTIVVRFALMLTICIVAGIALNYIAKRRQVG